MPEIPNFPKWIGWYYLVGYIFIILVVAAITCLGELTSIFKFAVLAPKLAKDSDENLTAPQVILCGFKLKV